MSSILALSGRQINTQGDMLISIDQQIGWCYPELGTVPAVDLAARVMPPRPHDEWTLMMKATYARALQLPSSEQAR